MWLALFPLISFFGTICHWSTKNSSLSKSATNKEYLSPLSIPWWFMWGFGDLISSNQPSLLKCWTVAHLRNEHSPKNIYVQQYITTFTHIYIYIPGTPNNQFLMDVWWNNHFPCKDWESSNWWPTIYKWLALEFQVYMYHMLHISHDPTCFFWLSRSWWAAASIGSWISWTKKVSASLVISHIDPGVFYFLQNVFQQNNQNNTLAWMFRVKSSKLPELLKNYSSSLFVILLAEKSGELITWDLGMYELQPNHYHLLYVMTMICDTDNTHPQHHLRTELLIIFPLEISWDMVG